MKKTFKTLSFVIVGALLLTAAGPLRPAFGACRGTSFGTKTLVSVSTTPASPTTILAPTQGACQEVKLLLLWSGSGTKPNGEYLLLSDTSSGFSTSVTTGTFRIPAGNSTNEFLDLGEYAGPLYGVIVGTTSAQAVSVVRKK